MDNALLIQIFVIFLFRNIYNIMKRHSLIFGITQKPLLIKAQKVAR